MSQKFPADILFAVLMILHSLCVWGLHTNYVQSRQNRKGSCLISQCAQSVIFFTLSVCFCLCVQNEDTLKKCMVDYQSKLKKMEEKYQLLKKQAEEKLVG